jgi:hypothetical protein
VDIRHPALDSYDIYYDNIQFEYIAVTTKGIVTPACNSIDYISIYQETQGEQKCCEVGVMRDYVC